MGSKETQEQEQEQEQEGCNTETEDGTIALQKKRSRRVSFAEITSVHVFDRDDEDLETPLDDSNKPPLQDPDGDDDDDINRDTLGFGDNSDDDDHPDVRNSFLRPIESPSPGGSTFGSATSNDEDNFFGPVSASFIKPGRLSDSATSDGDHDVTMDSTAFSMHFRSLARSDSGADLKTSTTTNCTSFDQEKTPQLTNVGSPMTITRFKHVSSVSAIKHTGGVDSNNMSIISDNTHQYDYGKLSPDLEALLDECRKDAQTVYVAVSNNPASKSEHSERIDGIAHHNPFKAVATASSELWDNARLPATTLGCQLSSHYMPTSDASVEHENQKDDHLPELLRAKGTPMGKRHELDQQAMTGCVLEMAAANGSGLPNLDDEFIQAELLTKSNYRHSLDENLSSISAKEQHILSDSFKSSGDLSILTPQKQPDSLLAKASIQNSANASLQRIMSRFKVLEASSFSFASKDIPKFKSTSYLFETPPSGSWLEEEKEKFQIKQSETPVACMQNQLLVDVPKAIEQISTDRMRDPAIQTIKSTISCQFKETIGLVEVGGPLHQMSSGFNKVDQPIAAGALQPDSSQPEKKSLGQFSLSDCASKGASASPTNDLLEMEVMLNCQSDGTTTIRPDKFVSSPVNYLEKNSLPWHEHQATPSRKTEPHDQFDNHIALGKGKFASSSSSIVIPTVDKSLTSANGVQVTSPSIGIASLKSFTPLRELYDGEEINNNEWQNESQTFRNLRTPRNWGNVEFPCGRNDDTIGTQMDSPCSANNFSLARVEVSTHGPASLDVDKRQQLEKAIKSPSIRELYNASQNDGLLKFVGKDGLSSQSHRFVLEHGDQDICTSETTISTTCSGGYSRKKRRNEAMELIDGSHIGEIVGLQRNSKVCKVGGHGSEVLPKVSNITGSRNFDHEGGQNMVNWADVCSKVSVDANQVLSMLTNKLSLKAKLDDHFSELQHKRVAETKLLYHRIVFEQAKLRLSYLVLERLQRRAQQWSTRVQECQKLMLDSTQHLQGTRDAEFDSDRLQISSARIEGNHEITLKNVTRLRQEIEAVDCKIKNLHKSFHTYCKIKGELSHADTMLLINDLLKKRARCHLIHQDLQLWEVVSLEGRNGHKVIVLSYQGMVYQRFTMNLATFSGAAVSIEVNNVKVAEVAGSVLCNLLDVVGESQIARIQLQNLVQTAFSSPSDKIGLEHVNLEAVLSNELCGEMVSGVYPIDAVPLELQARNTSIEESMPQSLRTELKAAVQNNKFVYTSEERNRQDITINKSKQGFEN
ncbi:hypothetical protein RJ641_015098 [Dillenia turbinata]|uniref:Knl1 C-terminal RWD domain-containing protein n=1 Tax=Dillenia turbinata TaxID=194707 RepID=A0AAN8URH0_9MAGN